ELPPPAATPPVREGTRSPAAPLSPSSPPTNTSIRINLEHMRHLESLAGELLIKQNGHINEQSQIHGLVQSVLACLRQHVQTIHELWDWSDRTFDLHSTTLTPVEQAEPSESGRSQLEHLGLDALEMDRHNRLHELVQTALEETSLLESLLGQVNQSYKRSGRSLQGQKRLLAQTWDTLTNARMQALQTVFQRLPRLIRQLTTTYGKTIDLVLPENDILVDRLLVEPLHDSLLHLLRNAFDHGIESAEIRQARGKSPTGKIQVRAFNQGQYTVIEVEDDGGGIDPQVVAQRAVERGLIPASHVSQRSPEELMELLFEPGFSTASQLSDLSGRGVGLDVVRSQLAQLNGSVTIQSVLGQGTCFTLRLPLTLTILRQMLCEANGIVYAFPIEHIEQIILPKPNQVRTSMEGSLVLQGIQRNHHRPVRLYRLGQMLQYAESCSWLRMTQSPKPQIHNATRLSQINTQIQAQRWHHSPPPGASSVLDPEAIAPGRTTANSPPSHIASDLSPILLLRFNHELLGIMVDKVIEEQELVIRPLGQAIAPPPCLHGCSIFGDNQLALVLDPLTLMHQVFSQTSAATTPPPTLVPSSPSFPQSAGDSSAAAILPSATDLPAVPEPVTILVVDDSPTVRQHLIHSLEDKGYRTQQASNGREALAYLRMSTLSRHPARPAPSLVICDVEMPILDGFQFLMEHRGDPTIAHIPVVMLTSRSGDKHRNIALGLGAKDYLTKPCPPNALLTTLQTLIPNRHH
ncbi:MAG: response regulator, partial [Leptolyngbyaceae cyanobacterium]